MRQCGIALQTGGIVPNSLQPDLTVLGLQWPCTQEEIKKAFRAAAMKHHPDHFGDAEKFKEAKNAYDNILQVIDKLNIK